MATLLSEGQMPDSKGVALIIDAFPNTKTLLVEEGYDADWLRQASPGQRIEKMFGKLKYCVT
jgi:hypothetical protein